MKFTRERHFRDFAVMALILVAFLCAVAGVFVNAIQALLPIAALSLALLIYLVSRDRNIRIVSGALSFVFGMSTISNLCWYLVPDYLAPFLGLTDLVNWYYYYYVTGTFWLLGYITVASVLVWMLHDRQWHPARWVDRIVTAASLIGIFLIAAYVFLNINWQSKYLIDIFELMVFLWLDVIIVSTALKMALSLRSELRYLTWAIIAFFGINSVGDLLFEASWLFGLSKLITISLNQIELSFPLRNLIDVTYNISLVVIAGILFMFVLDQFARRTLDEVQGRLKDTQLFVDDLVAKSPDATCIFDHDGQMLLVNDAFLQIFGLKRGDIARSFNIFSHIGAKILRNEAYAEILKVRDSGTVIIPKLKIKCIPGGRQDEFYLYVKVFTTYSSEGEVANYVMIIEDITARIEMETALRQSEEKFRVLAETSPVAICLFRGERFLYTNPAVERISGYSREDFASMNLWDLLTPEYRDLLQERMKARMGGIAMPSNYELCIVTKSKELKWVSISIGPVDISNSPAFMVSAFDITERMQAEEALRESEERFRAIFEQAAVGIAHVSLDGKFISANHKYCDITGYSPSEMLQLTWQDLTFDGDRAICDQTMADLIEGKSTRRTVEKRYIRKDGSLVWVNVTVSLVSDAVNLPKYLIAVAQDINERKRLEDDLFKAYNSLKAEYERKIDFTNAAAHELRTPLTPIIGYTDVLKAEVKDERHRHFLEIIERNALRQKTLVNRMLELASLDAGMAHVHRSDFALSPLVMEIADNYRAVNPNIRVEVPAEMRIDTDPDILRHVLDNLVSNAVKYSDNDKEIEIRVSETGDSYQFSVKDRGAGIPEDEWGKIFERFYIVGGDSDSRSSGRSGLGLALVRAYIRLIGGNVWLDSEPGRGSIFFFTVPRRPSHDSGR